MARTPSTTLRYVFAALTATLLLFATGSAAAHGDGGHGGLDTGPVEEHDAGDTTTSDAGGEEDVGGEEDIGGEGGDDGDDSGGCGVATGEGSAPVSGALIFLGLLALRSRNG